MCIIALGLSFYALLVEFKKEHDDSYEAMCDISEHMSCTKAFISEYGKGFGLLPKDSLFNFPNSIYGLACYMLFAILTMYNNFVCSVALIVLGIFFNICSIYLAYILYLLNNFCVICVTMYVINLVITIFAVKKLQKLTAEDAHKKKSS